MKVLILGSGAREHTLAWKFARSNRISGLYIAPGNAGTDEIGENIPDLDINDPQAVVKVSRSYKIDVVFIGPEQPLAKGVADSLSEAGIGVIGPHRKAAMLESSKLFSKQFMNRHDIPTAQAREFAEIPAFEDYIRKTSGKLVIKKNGLAAGKGVLESDDKELLGTFGRKILADDTLLVEEYLEGYEISIFTVTDGKTYKLLPPCSDFKKAMDDDAGPNTGGMGSICPVPIVTKKILDDVADKIVQPTFEGIMNDNLQFKGVLYFGLMITPKGPKVLEYNVRLGDPETQVLLPLIDSDFGNLAEAVVSGTLADFPLAVSNRSALGVVVASTGYPGEYETGKVVKSIPVFPEKDVLIFHAQTTRGQKGEVRTGGGRCFTVVGLGQNLINANLRAYEAIPRIQFNGSWYRTDIGKKFLIE